MRTFKNRIGHSDLRSMLLAGGAGEFTAIMSIPYMNFLPSTTDPYAQGVIQLVQGLQRLLNKNGAKLVVDGGMGQETVRALVVYAGPRWFDKSWAQLYADVMDKTLWPGWQRYDRSSSRANAVARATTALGMTIQDLGDAAANPTYCSTANQPPGCTAVDGVVKPVDAGTLAQYQALQRAANALLAQSNEPLIDVDGRIGPQTLAALLTLSTDPGSISSVETIAQNIGPLLTAMQSQVLAEGAQYVPDPVPKSPPSVAVGNTVVHPSDAAIAAAAGAGGLTGFLMSPLGLVTMAAAGYFLYKSSKKKRASR